MYPIPILKLSQSNNNYLFKYFQSKCAFKKTYIYMIDNAQTRIHKARSVPYALRDNVEAELSRLEQEDIIRKVDHTDCFLSGGADSEQNCDNLWRHQGNHQSEC